MVFKAVSGVDNSAHNTFIDGQKHSDEAVAALDTTNRLLNHYKNRIVLNWKDFDASEVLPNELVIFNISSRQCFNLNDCYNTKLITGFENNGMVSDAKRGKTYN